MNAPIARLTKHNHQKHIIEVMPFIAAVFAVQCYLMTQFTTGVDIGDLALIMASSLVGFIVSLYLYDENHHVLIFEDKLTCGFLALGQGKTIHFKDIERIEAPDEEKKFSTLLIKLKDGRSHTLYFIDYPAASKRFLSELLLKLDGRDEDLAA